MNGIIMKHCRAAAGFALALLFWITSAGCHAVRRPEAAMPVFRSAVSGPVRPWSGENFRNQARDFQFVIVADRTGGMRPGVFEEAVRKINLLQPEFVISIGDLIDGYTEDEALLQAQWQEFEAIIAPLEMPFFFMSGNHDLSNARMRREWQHRLGPTYYHFLYHNVLFLCLDTEDPAHARLSAEQLAYFREVLERHRGVRWTLVFMHVPLWAYGDQGGYEQLAALLRSRPYTVFSGHHHNYFKSERAGARHLILATTGGVSAMRGAAVGEFDHLMWVTMTDDGPRLANLELQGIRDENVVDDTSNRMVRPLREGSWFAIAPVVHETADFTALVTTLLLRNEAPQSMHISGTFPPQSGVHFSPDTVALTLPPESSQRLTLTLRGASPVRIAQLDPLWLQLTAAFDRAGDARLALSTRREVVLDWKHECRRTGRAITVDGDLEDWAAATWYDCRRPAYIKEDWDWRGPDDGWFRFATEHDEHYLHIAIQSHDEKLLLAPDRLMPNQDKFVVELDARDQTAGSPEPVLREERDVTFLHLAFSASHATQQLLLSEPERLPAGVLVACRASATGLRAELAVPFGYLEQQQSRPWRAVRLNLAYMDHDNPANTKPSVLWWRAPWTDPASFAGSGTFYRK